MAIVTCASLEVVSPPCSYQSSFSREFWAGGLLFWDVDALLVDECLDGFVFVVTIVSLIRYVEKSDRELSGFLMTIRQNDFTNTYPAARSRSNQLHRAFNVITAGVYQITE